MKLFIVLLVAAFYLAAVGLIDPDRRQVPAKDDGEFLRKEDVDKILGICLNHKGFPTQSHHEELFPEEPGTRGKCFCMTFACMAAGQRLGQGIGSEMVNKCTTKKDLPEAAEYAPK